MHRCYVQPSWIDQWIQEPSCAVPEEVAHRFLKVVRIREQEEVALFDGNGRQVVGIFMRQSLCLKDGAFSEALPFKPRLTVLQAVIDENKLEETFKRGTEIGVDRFVVFNAQKSEAFLLAKLKKRQERLKRLVIDAARQSGRLYIPDLLWANNLAEALNTQIGEGWGIFGDLASNKLLSSFLKNIEIADASIAIGPEGGLSEQEKSLLLSQNFHGVRWAPFTLRTELAGVMAAAIINAFWGRA